MFFKAPIFLQKIFPSLKWQINETDKIIYLTFDDGPIPEVTEFVLDTLAKFNAYATFFCIGDNIKKHPEVFKKIIAQGHRLGNHTMHHKNGWKTEDQKYFKDIRACGIEISKFDISEEKSLFRPPYGQIRPSQIQGLKNEFDIMMWTVLSQDYRKNLKPEKCLKESIAATTSGAIVLFHDSLKAKKNLTFVLPRYMKHFKDLGYKFEKL